MDVRGKSSVTDFIMVASCSSPPHVRALYDEVQHQLKKEGVPCYRQSGAMEGGWMVLDYVHVIVHLFLPETRVYYALEELWSTPPKPVVKRTPRASALDKAS